MARLPHLATLRLCDCKAVSNKGLRALARLPSLTALHLTGATHVVAAFGRVDAWLVLTDKGVRALGALSGLRDLTLDGCPRVTDKGVQVCIFPLPSLHCWFMPQVYAPSPHVIGSRRKHILPSPRDSFVMEVYSPSPHAINCDWFVMEVYSPPPPRVIGCSGRCGGCPAWSGCTVLYLYSLYLYSCDWLQWALRGLPGLERLYCTVPVLTVPVLM